MKPCLALLAKLDTYVEHILSKLEYSLLEKLEWILT